MQTGDFSKKLFPLSTKSTKATVLVVDDEQPIRELCSRILKQAGFNVELAKSGDEAWALLSKKRYDLVLTDLRMPGELSATDLVSMIRKEWPSTDVIIMTGYPMQDITISRLRKYIFDYLMKPFDTYTMLDAVRGCLNPFSHQNPA